MNAKLFSLELDGIEFQKFDRYKRWFIEIENQRPERKIRPKAPTRAPGLESSEEKPMKLPPIENGWIKKYLTRRKKHINKLL